MKSAKSARQLLLGFSFVAPWVIGFLSFTLIPVALSLYYSFCEYSLLQSPVWTGLENYRVIFTDSVFWQSVKVTAVFAAFSLPLGMVVALSLAMLLNVKIRGQAIYRTIIYLPSLVPAVASAMIWLWIFNPKLGLINLALRSVGIHNPPGWLGDANWSLTALIIISLWGVGNTVVIYLAGLQDVPRELYEAAELDGAGVIGKIFNVTIPAISPVIFFNLIMSIIATLQTFTLPYILTPLGQPGRATYFYTMHLFFDAFNYLKMGEASALAWIQLIVILLLTALAFWSSKRWVHYQGK